MIWIFCTKIRNPGGAKNKCPGITLGKQQNKLHFQTNLIIIVSTLDVLRDVGQEQLREEGNLPLFYGAVVM